jgi:hypothetical protein
LAECRCALAGQGWRLQGRSRYRRIVILRRRIEREWALSERDSDGQLRLGFAEIAYAREVFEYAVLVTSLDSEILSLGQLYRDRPDCENSFDELKNHWGSGGFTTRDLKRCRLMAGCVALVFNWWNLFVRLADPAHHREAIISRPPVAAGDRPTDQPCRPHHRHHHLKPWRAWARPCRSHPHRRLFRAPRKTAEQLTALERWYRILSEALKKNSAQTKTRPDNCRRVLPVTVEGHQNWSAPTAELTDLGSTVRFSVRRLRLREFPCAAQDYGARGDRAAV